MTTAEKQMTECPRWCAGGHMNDGFHRGAADDRFGGKVWAFPYRTPIDGGAGYVDQIKISVESGEFWVNLDDAEDLIQGIRNAVQDVEMDEARSMTGAQRLDASIDRARKEAARARAAGCAEIADELDRDTDEVAARKAAREVADKEAS